VVHDDVTRNAAVDFVTRAGFGELLELKRWRSAEVTREPLLPLRGPGTLRSDLDCLGHDR
jgi:hypothetical protein